MRTVEVKVYSFEELTPEAQAKALDKVREFEQEFGMEPSVGDAVDTIKKAFDEFGINLKDWSIGTDRYRSFVRFDVDEHVEELKGMRLRTWLLNNHYNLFFQKKTYGKHKERANGKWSHDRYSKIIFVESSCPLTGVCYDEDFLDTFRAFIKKPNNSTLEDLLNSAADDIFKTLESEYEWRTSDEGIMETSDINDSEFTEYGEVWNG